MVTLYISIPDKLNAEMLKHNNINWSAVACKAFEERICQIQTLRKLAAKSRLLQKDVDEFSDTINANASQKFMDW